MSPLNPTPCIQVHDKPDACVRSYMRPRILNNHETHAGATPPSSARPTSALFNPRLFSCLTSPALQIPQCPGPGIGCCVTHGRGFCFICLHWHWRQSWLHYLRCGCSSSGTDRERKKGSGGFNVSSAIFFLPIFSCHGFLFWKQEKRSRMLYPWNPDLGQGQSWYSRNLKLVFQSKEFANVLTVSVPEISYKASIIDCSNGW